MRAVGSWDSKGVLLGFRALCFGGFVFSSMAQVSGLGLELTGFSISALSQRGPAGTTKASNLCQGFYVFVVH